ncbi:hypothetical protein JCM19232_3434 [Vibrio ishigakensis]|uniref:Uncharacterized protein n=1 Tax=Vibrio ishigakensis TaxID=1481914 RepID=A0A0B8PM08_9VIBR|nr:hypothetical protein JCM19232_3434 [Vibrio ishigakensis]
MLIFYSEFTHEEIPIHFSRGDHAKWLWRFAKYASFLYVFE